MFDIPKTKNPEKWINDVALDKGDFTTDMAGGVSCKEYWEKRGMKPKFEFKDGKAINCETGEVIDLGK